MSTQPQRPKSKRTKQTRDPEGSIIKKTRKLRTANGREKTIEVFYARVRWRDSNGGWHEKKRKADSFNEAISLRRSLHDEIKEDKAKSLLPAVQSLFQLISYYESEYVHEAVIRDGQKVSGFRDDLNNIRRELRNIKEYFGDVPLDSITYESCRAFKNFRLATPYFKDKEQKNSRERSVATVGRDLTRLRRVLTVGVRLGWLSKNPFSCGDALISQAMHNERLRLATVAEENALLALCVDQRAHCRAIIICALDTAMRRGEIFKLLWRDIDFESRMIRVMARNTKTLRPRLAPLTRRLEEELLALRRSAPAGPDDLVFGITTNIKKAFVWMCKKAGCPDLHFHDLRATAITRMLQAGVSAAEVMKISGHTQSKTFMRYVRQSQDTAQVAGSALDAWLERAAEQSKSKSEGEGSEPEPEN